MNLVMRDRVTDILVVICDIRDLENETPTFVSLVLEVQEPFLAILLLPKEMRSVLDIVQRRVELGGWSKDLVTMAMPSQMEGEVGLRHLGSPPPTFAPGPLPLLLLGVRDPWSTRHLDQVQRIRVVNILL